LAYAAAGSEAGRANIRAGLELVVRASTIANGRGGFHFSTLVERKEKQMPLNTAALAPRARERYLTIGRRYLTAAVLAQANKTLRGLQKYAIHLARHGFGPRDGGRLTDGRDSLLAYETGRSSTATERKLVTQSNVDVEQNARDARHGSRSVLAVAGDEALEQGADAVSKRIDLVLEQTRVQPEEEVQLLDQLEALYPVITASEVLSLIADRGGPETITELVTARGDLTVLVNARSDRAADPATADDRDIVDGYVVTLTRRARAAANVAARRLGQPAIAEAFKLTHLRPRSGNGAPPDEPGDDEPSLEPTEPVAADPGTPADPSDPAA
jgi:hypothetical protein